jgi:hypothetical protein
MRWRQCFGTNELNHRPGQTALYKPHTKQVNHTIYLCTPQPSQTIAQLHCDPKGQPIAKAITRHSDQGLAAKRPCSPPRAERSPVASRRLPFAICLLVTRYHHGAARVVMYIPVQPSTPQTQGFPHQHPKAELSILHHHPPQFLNLILRPSTIQPSLLFSALALKEVKGN